MKGGGGGEVQKQRIMWRGREGKEEREEKTEIRKRGEKKMKGET